MTITTEHIETIIENNCINCKHFREPLSTSPCLCDSVYEAISRNAADPEKEQSFVEEWEQQQQDYKTKMKQIDDMLAWATNASMEIEVANSKMCATNKKESNVEQATEESE